MDDEHDYDPEEDQLYNESMALHFSIDFDLNNPKLNDRERNALRRMILDMVTEATVKVQLFVRNQNAVKIHAEERSSSQGTRIMRPPRDQDHE